MKFYSTFINRLNFLLSYDGSGLRPLNICCLLYLYLYKRDHLSICSSEIGRELPTGVRLSSSSWSSSSSSISLVKLNHRRVGANNIRG